MLKQLTFYPKNVCSRAIDISLDDSGTITHCAFTGGCSGNTQGVCRLVTGMKATDAAALLRGIHCGLRPTSCPDQLSRALDEMTADCAGK